MSTLGGLYRNAIRSNFSICKIGESGNVLHSLYFNSPRQFSTEFVQQPPQEPPVDPVLRSSSKGLAYARLSGISRNTLKTDIVNLLEGCDLSLEDVKFEYNRSYVSQSVMVQFPSRETYDQGFRVVARKGRLYKWERADRSQWDILTPYYGKTVLLQGIPRNALPEDVERFLSGFDYDASSLQIFIGQSFPDPIRMATVRFPSQAQAMMAFIRKNRGFCLNSKILMRVLQ